MPGTEQFRRAITEFRNLHIIAALRPLILMRTELISNDEFSDRGGTDDPTQSNLRAHLLHCDKVRRHVTHNPDKQPLGDKIVKAVDPNGTAEIGDNPFGGDDIQNASGGVISLIWALDGSDPDIPVLSQLSSKFKTSTGGILLGAIDKAIVSWTRLNSRDRTRFITWGDSMRVYGNYQEILGFIEMYLGDKNRIDVVQVTPSDEPLGPTDSPNRRGEYSQDRQPQS
jgi:hypothetical protein